MPVESPFRQAGMDLAEGLFDELLAEAARTPFREDQPLTVSRKVKVPADNGERALFLEGFWSRVSANSGLRHAEGVAWSFTLSGGYRGPSEWKGTPTGLPPMFYGGWSNPLKPVVFVTPPQAEFSASLHPHEKLGPVLASSQDK